jgi:hypothetical protein
MDTEAQALASRARELLFAEVDSTAEMFSRQSHRIALRESKADRMRLRLSYLVDYVQALVRPNEEDRKQLPLPGFLSFFYIVMRPIRLVRLYGLSLLSGRQRRGRS